MVSDRCDIRILFFMPIIKFPTLACLPSSHIIIKQHTIKYYMSAFENSTHKCDLFFCEIGCQSQLWLEILKKWNFWFKKWHGAFRIKNVCFTNRKSYIYLWSILSKLIQSYFTANKYIHFSMHIFHEIHTFFQFFHE